MQRLHLFEFNDLPWIPTPIRTTFLELLNNLSRLTGLYDVPFAALQEVIHRKQVRRIQALCAGDGGCAVALANRLKDVDVVMSDINPSEENFRRAAAESTGQVRYVLEPVDALDVPEDMGGMRVVINAVHHFQPDGVRSLLEDAIRKRQAIAFVEPLERKPLPILKYMVVAPPACVLMSAGAIWPPSPRRFLWGVALPASTAMMAFDGVVSHLRAYTPEEWRAMVERIEGHESFDWDIRQLAGPLGARLSYLVGTPKEDGDHAWH